MKNKIYEGGFVPANRAAAMAVSPQKTDELQIPEHYQRPSWDAQPELRQIPKNKPGFVDLSNRQFSRLRVVGLSTLKRNNKGGVKWVVRCQCGTYETRTQRAILRWSEEMTFDACGRCQYTHDLRFHGSKKLPEALGGGPWKECPELDHDAMDRAPTNHAGLTFGDLTIIGLPKVKRNGFRVWIVRCSCGFYERRSINGIRKKAAADELVACATCMYNDQRL